MKNTESTLDSILKKAATFSEKIDTANSLVNQLKEEKALLADKEASYENDLLTLVNSLYEFQQETISALSDIYAKLQKEAEVKPVPKPTKTEVKEEIKQEQPEVEETVFEVKKESAPVKEVKKEPQSSADEVVIEVKPEPKEEPAKEVIEEAKKADKPKKDAEVYLFDL